MAQVPETLELTETQKGLLALILPRPTPTHCSHFGGELADENLCLPLSLSFYFSDKRVFKKIISKAKIQTRDREIFLLLVQSPEGRDRPKEPGASSGSHMWVTETHASFAAFLDHLEGAGSEVEQ